jgi:hypothetical protein
MVDAVNSRPGESVGGLGGWGSDWKDPPNLNWNLFVGLHGGSERRWQSNLP